MDENDKKKTAPDAVMSKTQFRVALLTIIVAGLLWTAFSGNRNEREAQSAPRPAPQAPAAPAAELHHEYRTYPVMGTVAELSFYGPREHAVAAADKVYEVFREVENCCSIFNPASELARLNRTAAERPFACGPLLWEVLSESRRAWKLSHGAFDVTARPLMLLWGFYVKAKKGLPGDAERLAALEKVGLEKVIFDDAARTVRFTRPGMSFDLGGIAKGFAVERAANAVRELGIEAGIINLGGNMYCFPEPPPGKTAYIIGIRDPIAPSRPCGEIACRDISISTSGNYERYVMIDGRRYTHIMNVKTGIPVAGMLSVTVVTPRPTDSDWVSTSVFVNGPEFAEEIRKVIAGTDILMVREGAAEQEVLRFGDIWGEIKL